MADVLDEISILGKDENNNYKQYLTLFCYGIDYSITIWLSHQDIDLNIKWCFDMGLLEILAILVGEDIKPDVEMRS